MLTSARRPLVEVRFNTKYSLNQTQSPLDELSIGSEYDWREAIGSRRLYALNELLQDEVNRCPLHH